MYLDSSFQLCPVCNEYVLLDQSRRECAGEHACEASACPLKKFFTGRDFTPDDSSNPAFGEPESD